MTESFYDANAEEYAALSASYANFPGLLGDIDAFSARTLPGLPVVDLGCGAGRDLCRLKELGHFVIGVDLSLPMLRQATLALASRNSDISSTKAQLIQADLRSLPLSPGSFGGAWASGSFLHLPRSAMPESLRGVHRILARGGVMCLSMKYGTNYETRPDGRFFSYYSGEDLTELVLDSGFTDVHIKGPVRRGWLMLTAVK